jgi:hypothetical protein
VDLGVARVAEVGTLAVRAPVRRDIGAHGVGGEEEDVAIAAAGQDDGVGEVRLDLAGHQVAGDDPASPAVGDDELEHLVPGEHLDRARGDLAFEGLVGTDQELLAGLSPRIERPGDLHATEGTGCRGDRRIRARRAHPGRRTGR